MLNKVNLKECLQMGLAKLSEEEIEKHSLVDIAYFILLEDKKEISFIDLFHKVAEVKQLPDSMKEEKLAQFYTDINLDARFTALGSNHWGLKRWYPMKQTSEKQIAESNKRDLLEVEELIQDEEYKELGLEDEAEEEEEEEEIDELI